MIAVASHCIYVLRAVGIAVMMYSLSTISAYGQRDSLAKFEIRGGVQGGFIAAHREQMKHLQQGHSLGGYVQWVRRADGSQRWHADYNNPETGFDLFYLYTGNTRQLGQHFGLCYFGNLPLQRRGHEHSFHHWITLGIGPGFTTRTWDVETNRQADVLSTSLSAALLLGWSASIIDNRHITLRGGVRITHYSNGAFRIPNLGTNNLAVFAEVGVPSQRRIATDQYAFAAVMPQKWSVFASAAFGLHEVPPPTYPKYPVVVVSMGVQRRHSWKASFTGGVDAFNKQSLEHLFQTRKDIDPTFLQTIQVGTTVGYNLHFNRLTFGMQQGVYVYDQWKETGLLYHRFGLHYDITEKVRARLTLKTHFARADHAELGLTYVLH